MRVEVRVPELSESVTQGTLLEWRKKPGDEVARDETLVDLETDKVILDIPAPASGMLAEVLHGDGAVVKAGEVLAYVEEGRGVSGTVVGAAYGGEGSPPYGSAGEQAPDLNPPPHAGEGRVGAAGAGTAVPRTRSIRRTPMSAIRRRIAERLLESQRSTASLTTFNEVNLAQVQALRAKYGEAFRARHGVKLGLSGFFVRAAVDALKRYPIVNASLDGDDIVYHDHHDIALAVATDAGLVTPVLRDADGLSLANIERQVADFAQRARERKLMLEEITGGTFSITNGGVFGSMLSTPILNPPQSAILGMHRIIDRPVAENGQVVIRPMMYLALTYDHRLVDGREAVSFLAALRDALEFPGRAALGLDGGADDDGR